MDFGVFVAKIESSHILNVHLTTEEALALAKQYSIAISDFRDKKGLQRD